MEIDAVNRDIQLMRESVIKEKEECERIIKEKEREVQEIIIIKEREYDEKEKELRGRLKSELE